MMSLPDDEQTGPAPEEILSPKDIALMRLAAGISHELNNIFMVIQGNLPLIRDTGSHLPLVQEIVDEMLAVSQRGVDLSHKLQAYAGRAPLRPMSVDLKNLVRQTVPELADTILRDAAVELSLTDEPLIVHIDRDRMVAALKNLAENAAAAMGDWRHICHRIAAGSPALRGRLPERTGPRWLRPVACQR